MGSPRAGSNPARSVTFFFFFPFCPFLPLMPPNCLFASKQFWLIIYLFVNMGFKIGSINLVLPYLQCVGVAAVATAA